MRPVIFFFFFIIAFPVLLPAQSRDTVKLKTDSLLSPVIKASVPADTILPAWLQGNKVLNNSGKPVSLAIKYRTAQSKESIFYLLAGLVLLLAFFRFFFARYFTNLFRVFFNTSLRQSQLTDQLLQAKLPSLLFNLFFVISGGIYAWFLLLHYQLINAQSKWLPIALCTGVLGLVYLMKFCTLKFTGWVTGYKDRPILIFLSFSSSIRSSAFSWYPLSY